MKKNLLLRLCLILMVAFTAYSCRTDQFPEQETYNNSSKFQLTSKRISLNEAKHKTQLITELSEAKNDFKRLSKSNANAKTVSFGDSISVNTDNVIYMENGPDYHTYTFSIQRNNPLPDAPVENLVFTPLPEGGYKAYLVAYNFTEAEKNTILNGGNVSVNNKSVVTPLDGNFSSLFGKIECSEYIYEYYTVCSGPEKHHNGETAAQGCTGETKSQLVVIIGIKCNGGNPMFPVTPPDNGSGSGEPGGAVPNPCSVNGVYVNPQDPSNSDCNGGVVTQPNIEINFSETPCQKIIANNIEAKAILAKTKVAAKKTEITSTISTDNKEKSFLFGVKPDGEEETTPILQGTTYASPMDATHPDFKVHGGGHTHTRDVLNVTSPGDIYVFMKNNGINSDFKYLYTFAENNITYVLTITDQAAFDDFYNNYPAILYFDQLTQGFRQTSVIGQDYSLSYYYFFDNGKTDNESLELAMAYVIGKYKMGVGLSKMDANGNFQPIFVKDKPNPINPDQKVYEKTVECNL